jgi:spore coat polysaccharide biosynthesis protein SpsF
MGSLRLPGKVLKDIHGKPSVIQLLERLKRCHHLDDIVLATSTESSDNPLAELIAAEGFTVFRGSEDDVLNRVVSAHRQMKTDIIVEVTGDCPLIDPDVIDMGITTYLNNDCDVVSNTAKMSFAQGLDIQVFAFEKLAWVNENILDEAVREHVSLYFYENEDFYKIIHLQAPPCWHAPEVRCQVDYPEDLEFVRVVYDRLAPMYPDGFGIEQIMVLLNSEPNLTKINGHLLEKKIRV